MADDLRPKERGVLLALLLSGPSPLTSKELGISIDKETRAALESRGFVAVSTRGRSFEHSLTSAGRKWCLDDVAAGEARRGDSVLERSFYNLLGLLRGAVDVRAFVERPPGGGVDVESQVRAAYRSRRSKPGAWVSLADIRDELDAVPRQPVDQALKALVGQPGVFLEGYSQAIL